MQQQIIWRNYGIHRQRTGGCRGQAMVEYAILLILLVLLIAGGLELAMAAYNGHATVEAAKAGATRWLEYVARASCADADGPCVLQGVGLGDHPDDDDQAIENFRRPACLDTSPHSYDHGLPDGTVNLEEDVTHQTMPKVYLYNPLPLDISNCIGRDDNGTPGNPNDDFQSRVARLIASLPPLNQAIYAQYDKAFFDADSGAFIPIRDYDPANPNHIRLLRLPGWLDNLEAMSRLAFLDRGGNVTSAPTFALLCANGNNPFGPCDSASSPSAICWRDSGGTPEPLACNVQVQYRYRHVFESLVGMGVGTGYDFLAGENPIVENVDPSDQPFFSHAAAPAGVLGSELIETPHVDGGAIAARLKARADFLGCYATTFQHNGNVVVSASVVKQGACDYPRLSH